MFHCAKELGEGCNTQIIKIEKLTPSGFSKNAKSPGVVGAGEFGPIMTAAADNFLALAVVGFMKLSEALAVDLTLFVVEPVEAVEDRGRIGLERAASGLLLLDVMFGVEVADILRVGNVKNNSINIGKQSSKQFSHSFTIQGQFRKALSANFGAWYTNFGALNTEISAPNTKIQISISSTNFGVFNTKIDA